jgi:23S rRNA pseudouridine955/2504/2580 synthase
MQEFIVEGLGAPMRLDRYLRTLSPNLTQGVIEKALRGGDIKVLGSKAESKTRVQDDDIITISDYIKISNKQEYQDATPSIVSLAEKILGEYLILDHPDFFAIDKPCGVSSQGGSNISLSIDHALQYLKSQGHDLRIVHRLDKETSGVMLIAKNRLAATKLGEGFLRHLIKKRYIATVSGPDIPLDGRIESYLAKIGDKVIEVDESFEGAKLSITDYKTISYGVRKVIEFAPQTGRMHQIRCHAAFSLKNPIVGDKKYGGMAHHRLKLHAKSILIPAEIFGREVLAESDGGLDNW